MAGSLFDGKQLSDPSQQNEDGVRWRVDQEVGLTAEPEEYRTARANQI